MEENMEGFIYYFLISVLAILAILIFLCFIRAVKGPTITDRIVCVNIIGTLIIIIIAMLTVILNENWLADVSAVYAMISFLAVVVLTKIYIGVYRERIAKKEMKENNGKENQKEGTGNA